MFPFCKVKLLNTIFLNVLVLKCEFYAENFLERGEETSFGLCITRCWGLLLSGWVFFFLFPPRFFPS